MKRHLTQLLFGALAVIVVLIAGCTEDTTAPQAKIGKPTNVVLQKLSANSFSVSWTRAQNDNGSDVVNIMRTAPTTAQWQLTVGSPLSVLTIQDTSITNTGGSFTVTVASKDSTSDPVSITIVAKIVPAPTDIQVNTMSSTEIAVKWTRDAQETGVDTVIAVPIGGGSTIARAVILSTPAWLLTGLLPDVRYNISIASSTGHRSVPIEWATAARSAKLTLYETFDPTLTHHNGLILGPVTRTASITGPEQDLIDVVLATDNSVPLPYLALQGADVAGSGLPATARKTRFGNNYYIVSGGLASDFYSGSFAGEIKPISDPTAVNWIPLDSSVHKSVIILARTADNHYARIEIVPQSNGYLWKDVTVGASSYRAIDVIVSYQTIAGAGYASRPTHVRRSSKTPKVGGARSITK